MNTIKIHAHAHTDMSSTMHTHTHSGEDLSEIQKEIGCYVYNLLNTEWINHLSLLS